MKERATPVQKWRKPKHSDEPALSHPTVLYVEDNRLNRLVMSKMLAENYQIVLAVNDREACELLSRYNDELHFILMDIELQGSILNGIELARLINGEPIEQPVPEYAKGLPVLSVPLVFITAYSEKCDFMTFDLNCVVGVMHKPVDYKQLITKMSTGA